MNYEEMSDFEINLKVSEFVDFGDLIVSSNGSEVNILEIEGLFSVIPIGEFDPCNNWADAGPIMLENGIGISKYDLDEDDPLNGYWFSGHDSLDSELWIDDKNPLRAAMICFLKMKDAEI